MADLRKTDAQVCYEGYASRSGGRSLVSGAELPGWEDLPVHIQDAWEAAAQAVRDHDD
jgi:hypothetical protein